MKCVHVAELVNGTDLEEREERAERKGSEQQDKLLKPIHKVR